MNNGKGLLTCGENIVAVLGIGAILIVVFMAMGNADAISVGVAYAVDVAQWFFMRIVGALLIALGMVLLCIYLVAEVFSRRQYTPLVPKNVAVRADSGVRQLAEDVGVPVRDVMRLDVADDDGEFINTEWREIN